MSFFFFSLSGGCKLIRDFVFPARSCQEKCGRIRGQGDRVVGKIAIRFSKREKQNWRRPRSNVRPNSKHNIGIFFFFCKKRFFIPFVAVDKKKFMDNSSVVTHTIYDRVTSPISSFHTFPPGLLIQSFIMFLISSQSRLITLAPLSRRSCSPPKKFSFSASTTVRILYRIQVAEHLFIIRNIKISARL